MTFTATEKFDCAKRELKMRKGVYPRWVEQERMTQAQADREIAIMAEIVEDYRRQSECERLL